MQPERQDLIDLKTEWWCEATDGVRIYYFGIVAGKRLIATLGWVARYPKGGPFKVFVLDARQHAIRRFHPQLKVFPWITLLGEWEKLKDAKEILRIWWRNHAGDRRIQWVAPRDNPRLLAEWKDNSAYERMLVVFYRDRPSSMHSIIGTVSLDGADGDWYASLMEADGDTEPLGQYETYLAAQRAVERAWFRSESWFPVEVADDSP